MKEGSTTQKERETPSLLLLGGGAFSHSLRSSPSFDGAAFLWLPFFFDFLRSGNIILVTTGDVLRFASVYLDSFQLSPHV